MLGRTLSLKALKQFHMVKALTTTIAIAIALGSSSSFLSFSIAI
jgi:hypothetical protein